MCGIVGYIGRKNTVPILVDGLRRLEYRGYGSAGVAVVHEGRLAYHIAVDRDCDVDQPRNLAKSVTVE
jgi:glucosamine--fructose-6-phosphate aminotransferase (isomerizing)